MRPALAPTKHPPNIASTLAPRAKRRRLLPHTPRRSLATSSLVPCLAPTAAASSTTTTVIASLPSSSSAASPTSSAWEESARTGAVPQAAPTTCWPSSTTHRQALASTGPAPPPGPPRVHRSSSPCSHVLRSSISTCSSTSSLSSSCSAAATVAAAASSAAWRSMTASQARASLWSSSARPLRRRRWRPPLPVRPVAAARFATQRPGAPRLVEHQDAGVAKHLPVRHPVRYQRGQRHAPRPSPAAAARGRSAAAVALACLAAGAGVGAPATMPSGRGARVLEPQQARRSACGGRPLSLPPASPRARRAKPRVVCAPDGVDGGQEEPPAAETLALPPGDSSVALGVRAFWSPARRHLAPLAAPTPPPDLVGSTCHPSSTMADLKLQPHPTIPLAEGPVLVCVLDGWGVNVEDEFNAVFSAETPCTDALKATPRRYRVVKAHGTAVGLPSDADMGNSEVGHNALGSGQVIDQGARLVDQALSTGQMFELPGWKYISQAFADHTVHFIGLLSDGGVHSRYNQLLGCIKGAVERGAKRIRVHILTDGRDVPDGSSVQFTQQLVDDLKALEASSGCDAKVASGGGRMCVTMDRYEADWNIVKRGWDAHVLGKAPHTFTDPVAAIKTLRGPSDNPVSDQWLPPFVIVDGEGAPVGTVQDGDAVVLFNFRADRMVQISKAFEYTDFDIFDRERFPKDLKFVGMMQYDGDLLLPANYLVPPPEISKTSGEYLVHNGVSTFACSETQKFGHVTFFWNGNRSGYFDSSLETYLEIPSDKVPFNELPDMKAYEITEAGKEALRSGKYKMVRINYANPDMVGHTGDLAASKRACSTVDKCLADLLAVCDEMNGRFLVTSDHGNSDDMVQREKKTNKPLYDKDSGKPLPLTSHTLAPVPVYIGGKGLPANVVLREDLPGAGLANVTATYINLLGFQAPEHYQESLITTA